MSAVRPRGDETEPRRRLPTPRLTRVGSKHIDSWRRMTGTSTSIDNTR